MTPYYADDTVTLYHGDMRAILPNLDIAAADCIVTDPPYGLMHTSGTCTWDTWPADWPTTAATITRSMWCFGTMRTFLDRAAELTAAGWRMSQDVIWSKGSGTGVQADRFRRSHEIATHWYRGQWRDIHHQTPRVPSTRPPVTRPVVHRADSIRAGRNDIYTWKPTGTWTDDGTRYALSVITAPNMQGRSTHPTEKPTGVLTPLIEYACPPGGTVLDPFAGSGSTAEAARKVGRRAVLVEADEAYCERIARRLAQDALPFGASA
ncbi:DNA-methyltransferase [Micromonospora sp. WMMD734]|uniref:DNA-methyltransferase n=1 Tax=Micromonospora sp. WMMD734 TaxID=3404129 RepID=UPI003B959070